MYETLLYDVKDGVATITINRPEAGNAFSSKAFHEITQALDICSSDASVRVVIVTGSGKHFSVGGDVKAMKTKGYISYETAKATSAMSGAAKKCLKPVIAMVNGTAAGAGCGLALACDFRVMTEKSSLMTAFINMGLSGDTGCAFHLCNIVGLSKTIEIMMLSEPIGGEEALRLGLATKVASEGQLLETTLSLAETLKAKPAIALSKQKELVYNQYYKDYGEYCEMEAKLFDETGGTADHMEAVNAFFEKRAPEFKGI